MRNVLQYPVTRNEIRTTLQEALKQYEGLVGGVQPMILGELLRKLDDDQWFDSTFDKELFSRK